jgi:hypothetical protein
MKRIAGAVVLLTGLSGCISIVPSNGPEAGKGATDLTAYRTTPLAPPPSTTLSTTTTVPPPTMPHWDNATMPTPPAPLGPTGDYTTARSSLPTPPATNLTATPAPLPLIPLPPPQTPVPLMPGMPMVVPPRKERQGGTVPASCNATDPQDEVVTASRVDRPETPRPRVAMPPTPVVKDSTPAEPKRPSAPSGRGPLFRLVNSRRIILNFEVKDVGPSGLSSVEMWYTQDGKEWKKYDAQPQAQAYVVEVDEEGMYGFTLLARSGSGVGKEPPRPGDQPQVWVIVDLTSPDVHLAEVKPSHRPGQGQSVSIRWQATDKNLGRQPIALYYAEKEEGPWKVIATGVENSGKYQWQVPGGTPPRVLVRVEATDMAGNVGRAQSSKALLMDNSTPSVSIVNVEASSGN